MKATAEEIKYERRVKEAYRTYDRAFATAPQAWQERLQADITAAIARGTAVKEKIPYR